MLTPTLGTNMDHVARAYLHRGIKYKRESHDLIPSHSLGVRLPNTYIHTEATYDS
jgi:hypothetical protein